MESAPQGTGDFLAPIKPQIGSGSGGSLKASLKGWREIIVVCHKLLKWEQPYYAAIVCGIISLFFLLIWWLDPSVVTGFSMLIMIIVLADYLVPLAMPMAFPETNWSNTKEDEYSQACSSITEARKRFVAGLEAIGKLKETNPGLYMAAATVSLSTLAWLGNQMHNLLLAYFFALLITAIPGLNHHGLIDKAVAQIKKLTKKQKAQ